MNITKGILLRWDKLSISSMYLLNLSISGLLFSLTMPIWILQIISGQVIFELWLTKVIFGHQNIIYRFSTKKIIKYWSLGSFFCRSGSFIALLNLNSSTLFLVMMAIDRFLALTRPMQSYHFRTRKMVKINGLQRRTALNQTLGPAKDRAVGLLRTLKLFKAFLCCLLCWALSFATSSVAVPYRELGSYEYFVSKKNEYVTHSNLLHL